MCFPAIISKFLRTYFLTEHPPAAASDTFHRIQILDQKMNYSSFNLYNLSLHFHIIIAKVWLNSTLICIKATYSDPHNHRKTHVLESLVHKVAHFQAGIQEKWDPGPLYGTQFYPVFFFFYFLQRWDLNCNFIKKDSGTAVFSCEFLPIFKNTCFWRVPPQDSTLRFHQ